MHTSGLNRTVLVSVVQPKETVQKNQPMYLEGNGLSFVTKKTLRSIAQKILYLHNTGSSKRDSLGGLMPTYGFKKIAQTAYVQTEADVPKRMLRVRAASGLWSVTRTMGGEA